MVWFVCWLSSCLRAGFAMLFKASCWNLCWLLLVLLLLYASCLLRLLKLQLGLLLLSWCWSRVAVLLSSARNWTVILPSLFVEGFCWWRFAPCFSYCCPSLNGAHVVAAILLLALVSRSAEDRLFGGAGVLLLVPYASI